VCLGPGPLGLREEAGVWTPGFEGGGTGVRTPGSEGGGTGVWTPGSQGGGWDLNAWV
jgi:hypothetical protein